jgi:hypothetical protein
MKLFSRSRSDLILGLWALAPAIGLPAVLVMWQHMIATDSLSWMVEHDTVSPLTPQMTIAALALAVAWVIALILVIRDIWTRELTPQVRTLWTFIAFCSAPYGGLVCWLCHCHRVAPSLAATESV